ncbi:MAG: hypothetical protein J6X34_00185 [Clostridia bacterium]|nr:hypothetical protein [Clostridia bacterium]MBP5779637.1 hypothetical protein [Clostridia bacterium]
MMKRILSIALVFALFLGCMTVFTSKAAGELPFQVVAPANVNAKWLEGNDSPTTTHISYSLSNEMTDFFKKLENANLDGTVETFLAQWGIEGIAMTTQVDWAIDDVKDSVSGWHANDYWKADSVHGLGHDSEGRPRYSEWDVVDGWVGNATETVNEIWALRGVPNDERWNGNPEMLTPGVKEQLKPDQYTYNTADEELRIDFTKHTAYFRMRFVVSVWKTVGGETKTFYYYSDWSNIASVGKDAEVFKPLTRDDLIAPVITGLRMTDHDFNDNPVVAFTLTVPDKLAQDAAKVAANLGQITIEVQGRVKGDTEFIPLQGDWLIKAGEMEAALFALANAERPNVPKDAIIELRCRYVYEHPDYFDGSIYSDWSKIISFGTDDINYHTDPGTDGTPGPDDQAHAPKKTCPICHFCPQPLGLCIFIWLLIILAVIIVIVVIIAVAKKKKKDKK